MNEITDQLWISDIDTVRSRSLPDTIDTVVTTCQDEISDNVGCRYKWFNMADGEVDEYGGDDSYELFAEAVEYVRDELAAGRTVLVHCHVGKSRSAAVCATVLAAERDQSFTSGFATVEEARPLVNPKPDLRDHGRAYLSRNN